jgi:hypothetical protein
VTDWCDISSDVEVQGFRAIREAKRCLQGRLDELAQAGFLLRGGSGLVTGPVVVLEVVRPGDLEALRVSVPQPAPDS